MTDDPPPAVRAAVRGRADELIAALGRPDADVDEAGADGMTALLAATLCDDRDAARICVEYGADPTREWRGWTALDLARGTGCLMTEHLLVLAERDGIDTDALWTALIDHGHIDEGGLIAPDAPWLTEPHITLPPAFAAGAARIVHTLRFAAVGDPELAALVDVAGA